MVSPDLDLSGGSFDARGAGGSFDAHGAGGSFDARGAGGSFDARGAGGSFDARGAGGSFDARGAGGSFDARGAGGSFDPLVHPSGVAAVGGGLDPGAEGLPVLIGAAAGGLLGLASSCLESIACARAGFLLVVQQCFTLGLGDWLHFNPVRLKPVRVSAFFLAESGHG